MDYTVRAGELRSPGVLRSGIYFQHMPIGFYSHRGHAAVVLAFGGVLALLSLIRGWLRPILAWPLFAALVGGVYLTSTRGAQAAFVVGLFYLFVRFLLPRLWRKLRPGYKVALVVMIPLVLGGGFFLALTGGGTRKMPSYERQPRRYLFRAHLHCGAPPTPGLKSDLSLAGVLTVLVSPGPLLRTGTILLSMVSLTVYQKMFL